MGGIRASSLRVCEDWDLWLRLALRYSVNLFVSMPETLAVYRRVAGSMSSSAMRYHKARNSMLDSKCLIGATGPSRFLWRRQISAFNFYTTSIGLREEGSPLDLQFILKSLAIWPFPWREMSREEVQDRGLNGEATSFWAFLKVTGSGESACGGEVKSTIGWRRVPEHADQLRCVECNECGPSILPGRYWRGEPGEVAARTKMTIAIITGVYPPMIGGAGAVMHSLALHAPKQISVITCDFDSDGNRICCEERQLSGPDRVYRVRRLSRNLNWLPRGKSFRARVPGGLRPDSGAPAGDATT